ncbi:hypothetical protein Pcinc_010744 [Petrolisthes cinctipes]|uniref:RING-type E3 ubiquitin transferase n=1 Tax=Petrolisthes cinctipes TaxID=88211 RepID=A0AAE1G8E2_PETCI|nr:hypothetical protein Pcinc_010744 [Petrolisthes cinctipes]
MAQGGGPQAVLCRYFMSNVCNKGDQCRFSHDPSCTQPSMVCRYFLKGTCAYGDKCRYEHAWPEYMGTKIGETGSAPTSPQPTDVDMKAKKPVPELDVLSSHQQNMVNISSVGLGGAGLTPVLARVTPIPPPAAATLTTAPTPVPATTATLLHPPHPPPPHLQHHTPQAQPTALINDGLTNAQNMVKLVSISITQFVAMILDAHRIPHNLQSYKNKRNMTVEDARNSAQNLLAYVLKLGTALYSSLNDSTGDSYMELGNLLLRFWTEAKEPYPDLAFTYQDLHQMALHPEGRHLLENTLNQLQHLMSTLKSILNHQ